MSVTAADAKYIHVESRSLPGSSIIRRCLDKFGLDWENSAQMAVDNLLGRFDAETKVAFRINDDTILRGLALLLCIMPSGKHTVYYESAGLMHVTSHNQQLQRISQAFDFARYLCQDS